MFLLPFELIGGRGIGPGGVGLVLLPLGLVIGVLARPAGGALRPARACGRSWPRGRCWSRWRPLWLAASLPGLAVGVVAPLLLLALGMALVVAPLTTAVMNAAPDALAGAASGINNAASRLAGLFAVALVSAVAAVVFAAVAGPGARFGVFPAAGDPDHARVAEAFATGLCRGDGGRGGAGAGRRAATAWRTLAPAKP